MPLVDADDSALVLVDTQPGFIDHDKMSDEDKRGARLAVDRIAWILGLVNLMDIPVVAVEEDPEANGHTVEVVRSRLADDAPLHQKEGYSFASCDAALEDLKATGRTTVVVIGFETDVCVAQSAIELRERDYRVIAPDDLCYTTTAYQHEHGLRRMLAAGIEPNHLKGLIFEWFRTVKNGDELWSKAVEKFGDPPVSEK